MTEIVKHETTAASLPQKMEWARTMAASNLLPRQYQQNPGNLLYAVEYAETLGVAPMTAVTGIHVIEGKPSASADLIASLVRRAGHKLRVSGDDTYALAQLIRVDDPDFTYEARWDLAKARSANLLGKGVWKSYPGAMLRSRAITEVARMGASEALFGVIYSPEELGVETDSAGAVVHTVTRVQPSETQQDSPTTGAARVAAAINHTPGSPAGAHQAATATPTIPTEPERTQAETSVAEGEAGSIPASDAPAPSAPTQAQMKKMGALMREVGLDDRQRALDFVVQVIGRPVGSRNELSKDEAGRVIDALERDAAATPSEDVVDAEIVPDSSSPDAVWMQIIAVAAQAPFGWNADQVEDDFSFRMAGLTPESASASELQHYLGLLNEQAAA